jgi:hypothetical protein
MNIIQWLFGGKKGALNLDNVLISLIVSYGLGGLLRDLDTYLLFPTWRRVFKKKHPEPIDWEWLLIGFLNFVLKLIVAYTIYVIFNRGVSSSSRMLLDMSE